MLSVLFVTSEAYPLIKTGGLADVSGALPAALRQQGIDARILIPGYPDVLKKIRNGKFIGTLQPMRNGLSVDLLAGEIPDTGTPVIAISSHELYERPGGPYTSVGGYEWPDNPLRFATLAKVAAILASDKSPINDWQPDIVHCNDWQSGLTPAYMKYLPRYGYEIPAKSLLTIHNLAFQGNFDKNLLDQLDLPADSFQPTGVEYYGHLSFLKAGVYFADKLTTVSPNYAKEIQTDAFGFGMQGLLTARQHDLIGILNGLDTREWNPHTDPHLNAHYEAKSLANKAKIKTALQKSLGLNVSKAPILGVVSRMAHQKGLDILLAIGESVIEQGCQLVVLGSGEAHLEHGFSQMADRHRGQVSVNLGYNEPLSHRLMAGMDIFLMPSRFEPCGLNQMYGLRYGTPPVVSPTGGLVDSVTDTTPETLKNHTANGFVMRDTSAHGLWEAIQRALSAYEKPTVWKQIQRNGMALDLSWDKSAQQYQAIYKALKAQ